MTATNAYSPGYRFYPTEEELVSFYLRNKLDGTRNDLHRVIPAIDIYNMEPCQLPRHSGELCRGDTEQWFFFAARQKREASGGRPSRTTSSGYWKATGSPDYVYSSDDREIGVKKTMVFYKGRAPTGRKTKWKMNEYKAIEAANQTDTATTRKLRHEFSLCRVYVVSGSCRAFDRRPSEARRGEASGDGASTSSPNTENLEKTCSLESSYSGGDLTNLPGTAGNFDWETISDQEPLWEFEQLNWL